ncbi:MAG TPA: hypothetical protein PKA82_11085 [Pyrinomonadaceae bacterium]|nr:hypothetical protein [Pyrinomonadaceae bacterium]
MGLPDQNDDVIDDEISTEQPLVTIDGEPYEITEEGSLGLLAMGYVGVMHWRNERQRIEQSRRDNS